MKVSVKHMTQAALIAGLYVILSYLQDLILPGSGTWAIQYRISEALCVLAFFTPAAIPGLGIGCLLFNISAAGALPLDFLVGTLASLLAAAGMYLTRNVRLGKLPLPGLLFPALFNGLLVGWELSYYIGGGFWFNAGCVALGEVAVLLTLGAVLYFTLQIRGLDRRLF